MSIDGKQFDIVISTGSGIGNVVQSLFSFEYLLEMGLDAALIVDNVPTSFISYLGASYPGKILECNSDLSCNVFIQSWAGKIPEKVNCDRFFYIKADSTSSRFRTETELQLDLVQSIFPGGKVPEMLTMLKMSRPKGKMPSLSNTIAICPSAKNTFPVKRWGKYFDMMGLIPNFSYLVLGTLSDFDDTYS